MLTIGHIYQLAIQLGIQHDLRGPATVKRYLAREEKRFDALPADEKKYYDRERLTNPYSDTRVFAKDLKKPVRRVLAGIDIETAELLVARELSKTKPIDLVIAHHPLGLALAGLHEVMDMQAEILAGYGVPINVAEGLLHVRISEISRRLSPGNHNQEVDNAKLLGLDLMCAHTPTDNLVASFLQSLLKKNAKRTETVGDIMDLLMEIPEYQAATRLKIGPTLFSGNKNRFAGRVVLTEITGGTEGSSQIYQAMVNAGIGTVIAMHQSEEHKKKAEESHMNVIIAGHMSSDSLGLNLFLDQLARRGVEIVPTAGLIRHSRLAGKTKRQRPRRRR